MQGSVQSSQLELAFSAGETDPEELDRLTRALQGQLLELDVEGVERPSRADVPPGARAVDAATVGTLVVTVARTAPALAAVIGALRGWLAGGGERTIRVDLGGDAIEVTGASTAEQERLISAFIERHTR